jgi:hypothetical protein
MESVQAVQNKGDSERLEGIEQECYWITVVIRSSRRDCPAPILIEPRLDR